MAQQDAGSRIVAGAITIAGLVAVWLAIVTNLPSQSELDAGAVSVPTRAVAGAAGPAVPGPASPTQSGSRPAEPELDLTIPGVPSVPSAPEAHQPTQPAEVGTPVPSQLDPRAAQVTRLKCEAEIEQLCPDMGEGPARSRCLEQRSKNLAPPCRMQMQERFVRWKEDRSRVVSACQEDVRRFCAGMRPRDGRVVPCLQEHAQEVSDRCYQTLPKGTLLFRQ